MEMRTPQGKVATAYFARSGKMLAEIAEILGKEEDAAHYRRTGEQAEKAFHYIAVKDGKIHSDRQAEYVRAGQGWVPPQQKKPEKKLTFSERSWYNHPATSIPVG